GRRAAVIAQGRMAERFGHELRDGDRAGERDAPRNQAAKRCRACVAHTGTAGRRLARRIRNAPKATMGSDSSMPMVSQLEPRMNPRKESGSRNTSPTMRATP